MLAIVRTLALVALLAIIAIHAKMLTGKPLTPGEQRLFNECCK